MPVFTSHLLEHSELGVGPRIREERQRQGLTLRQVSKNVGLSESKLSNIETGKVAVDFTELTKLAGALSISVSSLFPRTRLRHHYISRASDVAAQTAVRHDLVGPEPGPQLHHNPVRPLADPFVGKQIEPLLADIQPLDDNGVHFISHDHETFMFVLHGEVETLFKTNDKVSTVHLDAGDALYFRSNFPHCIRSRTSSTAEALYVVYSLRGVEPHGGDLQPDGRRRYRDGPVVDAAREASGKINLLRRSHGVTLAALATELGIGVKQLAHIEAGEKAPDVDLVLRLARRFRRPIEFFLPTSVETEPYYFVQRGTEIMSVPVHERKARDREGGASANVYRPLASGFPERGMHPYYVQAAARSRAGAAPHEHYGQEFIYVLEGEVEFVTYEGDETAEVLRPGDALFLESSVPHLLRGHSRNPYASTSAEVIDVFWSPLGEDYLFER